MIFIPSLISGFSDFSTSKTVLSSFGVTDLNVPIPVIIFSMSLRSSSKKSTASLKSTVLGAFSGKVGLFTLTETVFYSTSKIILSKSSSSFAINLIP